MQQLELELTVSNRNWPSPGFFPGGNTTVKFYNWARKVNLATLPKKLLRRPLYLVFDRGLNFSEWPAAIVGFFFFSKESVGFFYLIRHPFWIILQASTLSTAQTTTDLWRRPHVFQHLQKNMILQNVFLCKLRSGYISTTVSQKSTISFYLSLIFWQAKKILFQGTSVLLIRAE